MSELVHLQEWMAAQLRRRSALPKDAQATELAARHFTGNDRLSPVEQLDVYREQFWLRHTASLVEDFPGLGGILGQRNWERLVEEYLEEIAPASWSLRDLGDRLPAFVDTRSWLPERALSVDMARLEWAYIEVFDAADSPRLDAHRLAAIPESAWDTARIVLNPALRLLELGYPVADLRRALRQGDSTVAFPAPAPQKLVIHRIDYDLFDKEVGDAPFALLEALGRGESLVEAAEHVLARMPELSAEIEENVGAWFASFAELGLVVDVETQNTSKG